MPLAAIPAGIAAAAIGAGGAVASSVLGSRAAGHAAIGKDFDVCSNERGFQITNDERQPTLLSFARVFGLVRVRVGDEDERLAGFAHVALVPRETHPCFKSYFTPIAAANSSKLWFCLRKSRKSSGETLA